MNKIEANFRTIEPLKCCANCASHHTKKCDYLDSRWHYCETLIDDRNPEHHKEHMPLWSPNNTICDLYKAKVKKG